ncbi:MAG: hypothetical protein A2845_06285 [Candidatus Lloydbacteria bacterium RIFCSPHIGHO2_01_FULL_49_22]|uniref:Uncharacterized protein n=1 Tax=Candidatus Lloydbacteria bacterium RIFCSPHIGHO2_01_FULL_49_22 TaxID=1798658 RepID=A0A1G2CTS1_9BACT|nr:MAG: hypothetical protein A2845_06285 [Candidatus Lloydbacteria bacterium RIFCSPHIGHO2_01_FULL_49_22]OGZ09455.1 MAG: hypothetical protein A3C14_00480 [Candidatus Lloydbacteria bacterium RIFCSPHIGHO2_02_FULL_50_18]
MSVPILCSHCGDVTGELDGDVLFASGGNVGAYNSDCPGKGKHSVRESKCCFFGLLNKVTVKYHSAGSSTWYEYVGPQSRFLLWLAIMRTGGVVVNNWWVWWDLKTGFFGEGLKELLKKKTA